MVFCEKSSLQHLKHCFDEYVWFKMVPFLCYDHLICLHYNLLLC
jgi:hypothetical protein